VISGPNIGDTEPDATAVLNALMQQAWRIVHIAGHGDPPDTVGKRTDPHGVVLSGGVFLGPREIADLRVIPELVFVNCCYLATSDWRPLQTTNYDRARFASGVAHALIKGGVRCVIAAGWAVDDDAAGVFARTFYRSLLHGARFVDAVRDARTAARDCGGNTWAAYQCYGDPDWIFRQHVDDGQTPTAAAVGQAFAPVASAPALILALEEIAVQSEHQSEGAEDRLAHLRYLEGTYAHYWEQGDVAEAFGNAWAKGGRFEEAAAWYERARSAEDGKASLASIEQLVNARVRAAWDRVAADGGRSLAAIAGARKEIHDALTLLDTLLAVAPTLERECIYGSAYKRLALLEAAGDRDAEEQSAIEQMWKHYGAAEAIGRKPAIRSTRPFYYPAMNRIAAQLALADAAHTSDAMDADTIGAIRRSLSSVPPEFWSVVGQTELDMYVALAGGALARDLDRLVAGFRAHHARVNNPRLWGSVLDNATFVLAKHRKRAAPLEAAAAGGLLKELALLAGRGARAALNPSRPGAATRKPVTASKRTSKRKRQRRERAATRRRRTGRNAR
jgi:tetratricopeptide (TPR) repeat protein